MTRHSFETTSWLPPSGRTGECASRREEAGEKNWHVDYSSSGHQEKQSSPSGCSLVTIGRLLPPVLGSAALAIACAMWVAPTREVLSPALTSLAFLSLPAATHRPERETESRRNKPETSPLLFPSLPSDERSTGEAAISSRWMAVLQKYGTNYDPDSVCHKESHPSDKIGAPGCHKKWPEHSSTNWPR